MDSLLLLLLFVFACIALNGIAGILITILVMLLPLMIAVYRGHKFSIWCGLLGIFGSFIIFGWLIAMIWACFGPTETLKK